MMTEQIEIKSRNGAVIFAAQVEIKPQWHESSPVLVATEAAVASKISLSQADLIGAYLAFGRLAGADLRGARLYKADLRGADLRGADLRGADLEGAWLHQADFSAADLRGAKFSPGRRQMGANFRGAILH